MVGADHAVPVAWYTRHETGMRLRIVQRLCYGRIGVSAKVA